MLRRTTRVRPVVAALGRSGLEAEAHAHVAADAVDLDDARVHAGEAARLCQEWEIPLAGPWPESLRTSTGF